MAMAHRSPGRRQRRVNISDHCLDSLAKRMDQRRHGHRMRHDLGNLLDQAINEQLSKEDGRVEEFWESREDGPTKTTVVDIGDYYEGLYAILRPDAEEKAAWACVTVLTENMVNRNKTNGRWGKTPEQIGKGGLKSSPFKSLRDSFPDVPSMEDVKPINEEAATEMKKRAMVVWKDGVEERKAVLLPNQVGPFVKELLTNKRIARQDITLWAQRELVIELEPKVSFDL